MPFIAAGILGAASLGGSLLSSSAASSAASTQAAAADRAGQLQAQEFQTTQGNLSPFLRTGTNALNMLAGLTGTDVDASGNAIGNPLNAYLFQSPLSKMGPVPSYNMPPFTASMYQSSPGYNATLQGGTQALQNAGTTTTGPMSGNVLKALQGYGTGLANTDFQQGYQNYATNYGNQFGANNANFWNQYNAGNQNNQNIFNWLSYLGGSGQNAGANLGSLGATAAGNAGNALIGAGNATASGIVGSANAFGGGLNSLSTLLASPNNSMNNSFLSALINGGGSGGGYGASGTGGLY